MQQSNTRAVYYRPQSVLNTNSQNNHQYYLQFKRLYEQALKISQYYHRTQRRQNLLFSQIGQLCEKSEEFRDIIRPESEEIKKKKIRRPADQIDKEYACPIERCDRTYGTQASLRIHIKKKHSDQYEPRRKQKNVMREESALMQYESS